MKPLVLKKNSFGLRVFCPKCNNKFNHDKVYTCKHPRHQKYKQYVYKNDRAKVKTYHTRDFNEALKLAIDFKANIANEVTVPVLSYSRVSSAQLSIIDSGDLYVQYKNGIDVFDFEKKSLNAGYLSSIQLYIQQFVSSLDNYGVDVYNQSISSINRAHVDIWWSFITKHYDNDWSRKAALTVLRGWIDHVIGYQEINMRNPFKDVKLSTPKAKIITITQKEFEKLCIAVNEENPIAVVGKKKRQRKNRHKVYLRDAFKLGLMTGLRREELVNLRWCDIHHEDASKGDIITTENLKVQRSTGKAYKLKYIPVFDQLHELLLELGLEENRGSENYILFPERTVSNKTMQDAISKGFSHFYKQAFPNNELKQFKCLRKTYLSYLERAVGDDMIHLSSHSGKDVLEKHYLNPAIVTKGYEMTIF